MPTHSPARSTPTGPPSRPRGRAFLAATAASALALGALLGVGTAATAAPLPAGTTFDDGMVYVGENYEGELGNGSLDAAAIPTVTDYTGSALEGKTIKEFAASGMSHLVLTDDGTLLSWGRGGYGQLGDGTTDSARTTATVIDVAGTPLAGKTVTSIARGHSTAYALTSDGTIAAWGRNDDGELGDGTTDQRTRPTAVDLTALGGKQVASLFAMYRGALVQTTDGSIFGWGINDNGMLVPGTSDPILTATPIDVTGSDLAGKTIAELRWSPAGASDSLVNLIRTTDSEVLGWGEGTSGFIGQGVLDATAPKPTTVPALAGITITELQAGAAGNALALTDSGDVYSWGDNYEGALGFGNTAPSAIPTKLILPAPAIKLEAGFWTGFAILADGTVSAWGDPSSGTLGQGVNNVPQTPKTIPTTGTALAGRDVISLRSTNGTTIMFTEPATITPISILTPADGATVEPGFTVTGTGEYASVVTITDEQGGNSGFLIENTDGTWSVDINDVFGPGTHTLTFTQQADGSVDTLTFTINAAPVITPVTITGPDAGSTVGLRPTLTGAGTPDAIVTITDGSATLGTATVGTTGTWTFTPTADLALGAHTFTATQDVDSSTATVAVTVAATVPTPDPTPSPTPGAGHGAGNGELSSTGADAAPLLLIGGLLAAAGIAAAVLGRRQRQQAA